jgi:isopenicillin-N N-acyltransferase like protein
MTKIRVLEIAGTPYEMGYQHGLAYIDDIRELTEERVQLSSDRYWTGRTLARDQVMALGEACLAEHRPYAPDLVEELEGMAAATGLGLAELVIMNGFTDFIDVVANYDHFLTSEVIGHPAADDCTAFIVGNNTAADGRGFFGQTWDMHATATPYVILLRGRPVNKPAFLVFTIIGCVGMIGMNDAGIAIGINNLLSRDGQPGVTWPFVIRKALEQTTLDDALACITSAKLAGAHNYLLADPSGHGYNVEAMATSYHIEALNEGSLVHTNHCLSPVTLPLERPRLPASQQSSEYRLSQAEELLRQGPITLNSLIALTRENGICVPSQPPMFVETCGAAIMRPATREFWAVWGLPVENEYERFVV